MAGRRASTGAGASAQQLNNVAKLISEAQTLDTNGDELGAYRHYLSCVAQLTQTLSNDIQANQGQGTLSQQRCSQLFTMAKRCLDRGEEIYSTAKKEQRPLALFRLASPSPTASPTLLSPRLGNGAPPHLHSEKAKTWPKAPNHGLGNVQTAGGSRQDSVDGSMLSSLDGGQQHPRAIRQLSYMELAKLRNQHMMEQYKAYLRETRSTNHLPPDAGLSMLRRLEENVSVAKIQEQAIARKLRERELRLLQSNQRKSQQSLTALSVDELCDLVTSYEHGKPAITGIKARLNTAGSNTDQTYSSVSELLSIADHPLAKLLGEGQYSVFMTLQPLVTAIEKAGGLPHLEIRLDNCGLDRKPSVELPEEPSKVYENSIETQSSSIPNNPPVDQTVTHSQDEDDLLDLLSEEDDDVLELVGTGKTQPNLEENLYHELERPESKESTNGPLYHVLESPDSGKPPARYQSFNFASNCAYDSVDSRTGKEPRYVFHEDLALSSSGEPVYKNNQEERSGGFYSVPQPTCALTSRDETGEEDVCYDDADVYENLDDIDEHIYEPLNNFGSARSSSASPEDSEPEPVFKNLPPLVCAAHFGDEASLTNLAENAAAIIKTAVKIIKKILATLEEVFAKCYPVLSSEDNREVCGTVLETTFFPPLLQPLSLVYRCKNYKEECSTGKKMCQHVNASPKDLSVRKKFWLIEQTYAPYGEAIDELRRLPSLPGPTPKLDGLVRMSKRIVKCIDEYYEGSDTADTGVGVDDILPILSYIIIRSGQPQLVTECSIMEEFIKDG